MRNVSKFQDNLTLQQLRSSKVIDLGVNEKPICDFLLVINFNFSRICYRFRDIHALKIENCWFFPPLPCLTPPLGGNPLEFLDKTYPAKTRGEGLSYGEKFIILTSTFFEILALKGRKSPILPTPLLFNAPALGEPLRISAWNLLSKN